MGMQKHGSLEALVRTEARRWGWTAEVHNAQHIPWADDGSGTVVLTRDGNAVSFEYHLPETESDILWQVRATIRADKIERERRIKGDANPVTRIGD